MMKIISKLKLLIAGFALVGASAFAVVATMAPQTSYALDPLANVCNGTSGNVVCENKDKEDPNKVIHNIVNILLYIVGLLSVVMIIYGGIIYATSAGDSGKVSMGKNTLLYAVVGLVVAVLAFAIVQWVFDSLLK